MRKSFNETIYPEGTKVKKNSGKKFKSGELVNTVKSVVDHPNKIKDGIPVKGYTFYEDESIVECHICLEVS